MADPDFFRDDASPTVAKQESKPFQDHEMDKQVDFFKESESEVDKTVFGKGLKEPVKAPVKDVDTKSESDKPLTKAELKKIAARYGETTYDVPLEAKLKHKVDGQEVELEIQELLNNYAGKTAWDKKFTELGTEKKKYQEELEIVNKYVNDFAEISKKDKLAGLIKLAESVGLDPLQYKRQLRSDLLGSYGDYLKMDEQQRAHYEQVEELNYLKGLRESEIQKQQQAQAENARQAQLRSFQEAQGIDNERMSYLQSELRDNFKLDVTPENLTELHTAMLRLDRVDNALKQVNPAFLDDIEKVVQLESLLKGNPKMTDSQLSDFAAKLYGGDVEKAIANLAKKQPEKVGKLKEKDHSFTPKLKATGNSINFFD
jgi:hypothetical protein